MTHVVHLSVPEKVGELLKKMDASGIARAPLCPVVNPEADWFVQTNEEVLAVAAAHPDRFVPFCNIDPRNAYNSPEADLAWIVEYYKARGAVGVGICAANLLIGDPRVENLFAACQTNALPLYVKLAPFPDSGIGLLDSQKRPGLAKARQRFPKLEFVVDFEEVSV